MITTRRLAFAPIVLLLAGGILGGASATPALANAAPTTRVASAAVASAADTSAAVAEVAALDGSGHPVTAPSGVDDFSFDSFDASYVLGRDGSKNSTLHTTEKLVAKFPEIDQNRGIVRGIPTYYDGHPTRSTSSR